MTDKPIYTLHHTTPNALQRMRSHKKPYEHQVLGLPIIVLPKVWSPAYDWSSLFYIENMPDVRDKTFLEIGCGTGIISVFAARNGSSHVVAADVNPQAIENARLNFERLKIHNAVALVSEGFGAVKGRFDVVTWNAPYHGNRPADALERGCSDENYAGVRAFFRDVSGHLNERGTVLFGFSESGDLSLIETLISDAGFVVRKILSDWRQNYNCMLFYLERSDEV